MTESIVTVRLTRNLRYKLTYIKIFESYFESAREAEVTALLKSLLQAYQEAIAPLASYLRRLDVATQELELDEKLMAHAAGRHDVESQLRFIFDGLRRAAAWYKTQLMDRQMTSDPELRQLLLDLGEIDAAKLWHTETIMSVLKIPVRIKEQDYAEPPAPEPPSRGEEWRPRLMDDVRRPAWTGSSSRPQQDRDRGRPSGRPPGRGPGRDRMGRE
jgi:hypothetical protein